MKKKLLSLLLLTIVLTIVPAMATGVSAEETTGTVGTYMVLLPDGVTLPSGTGSDTTVKLVTEDDTEWGTADQTTWYVATDTEAIEINHTVTVLGDVHLILADKCDLTVNGNVGSEGIKITATNSLTIYAQSKSYGDMGKLTAVGDPYRSGIGCESTSNGDITINGGKIVASGGGGQANDAICGREVFINGGDILADSLRAVDNLEINDGKIVANGGVMSQASINISGGIVAAKVMASCPLGNEATINISGGTVTITNGDGISAMGDSAAITIYGENTVVSTTGSEYGIIAVASSSQSGNNASIKISGGNVTATASDSNSKAIYATAETGNIASVVIEGVNTKVEAIGSQSGIFAKKIEIKNGTVNAKTTAASGENYAIGNDGGEIIISGGRVCAESEYIGINSTKLNIDGGVVNVGTNITPLAGINALLELNVTEGLIYSFGSKCGISALTSMNVSGGKVIAKSDYYDNTSVAIAGAEVIAGDLLVSAGTEEETQLLVDKCDNYSQSLSGKKYVSIGFKVCYIDENTNGIFDANEKEYGTIQSAINSIGNTKTIVLVYDDNENFSIPVDKNITLDLNGKILSSRRGGSIIANNGTLTIKDSGVDNVHYFAYSNTSAWEYYGDSAPSEQDIVIDTVETINNDTTHVKLYGGCITGGYTTEHGAAIWNYNNLTLNGGNIVGNTSGYTGAICIYADSTSASFTMNGGNVLGNMSNQYAGGVSTYKSNNPTFTMNGGSISYNKGYYGGGINLFGDKTAFTMNGGSISHNSGSEGAGITIGAYEVKCTINNGIISNNIAYSYAGGLYNANCDNNIIILNGGEITKNKSNGDGGGVYHEKGELYIGGTAKIYDNIGNSVDNLCIRKNINIGTNNDGVLKPASGMNVSVGLRIFDWNLFIDHTTGTFTSNGNKNDAQYFHSENQNYTVVYKSGHLELLEKCNYYVSENGNDSNNGLNQQTAVKTINDALDKATGKAATIILLSDINEDIELNEGEDVVLDLNGHKLNGNYKDCSKVVLVNENCISDISKASTLTIIDSTKNNESQNVITSREAEIEVSKLVETLNAKKPSYLSDTLNVELRTASKVADADMNKINENKESGSNAIVLDAKLFLIKNNNYANELNIGDSNDKLIAITYNFDFTQKTNIHILRVHGSNLDEITTTPNVDGEYLTLNSEEGTITVYAKKYSAFAITYKNSVNGNTSYKTVKTGIEGNDLSPLKLVGVLSLLGVGIALSNKNKRH